jgi:hypothetical protein
MLCFVYSEQIEMKVTFYLFICDFSNLKKSIYFICDELIDINVVS